MHLEHEFTYVATLKPPVEIGAEPERRLRSSSTATINAPTAAWQTRLLMKFGKSSAMG